MARRMRSPSLVVAGHLRRSAERTESQKGEASNIMARRVMTPPAPHAMRAQNSDRQRIADGKTCMSRSDHKRKPECPVWYDEDDDEEPSAKRIKKEATESERSMSLKQQASRTSRKASSTGCWPEKISADSGHKSKQYTSYDEGTGNKEDWDELPSYDEAQQSAGFGKDGSSDDVNTMELCKEAELIDRRLEIFKQLRKLREGV
ncbi:hypothetical protein TI39_contig285g00036 [Zymoseptoria brevis]|uniref:Uncharacterized protein n=1 Tax=Zymoseptoria brevis TaxID=1047168 RepID=A0A0F4GX49_9PEZI|nr:hypothetical protein TI39_contig285g00036 [Zymoseptoria brevis]